MLYILIDKALKHELKIYINEQKRALNNNNLPKS